MRGNLLQFLLVTSLALAAHRATAQDVTPDVLLKSATAEVIDAVRKDANSQAGDQVKVTDLVERRLLPLFDFTRMTQTAVARNWRLATPDQQHVLTKEFKTLLVRTYSAALSSSSDQTIEFKPLRLAATDSQVTVRSLIKQPGKQPLPMDYHMAKSTGTWLVSDITIDGMSLIMAYRETFASKVQESGIEGLIKMLSDKNRQDGARTAKS